MAFTDVSDLKRKFHFDQTRRILIEYEIKGLFSNDKNPRGDFAGHSAEHKSDREILEMERRTARGISGFLYGSEGGENAV